jgi:protein involved in polysaccharide export with SLBB domain
MLWLFKAVKARFDPSDDPWSEQAKRRRQSRAKLQRETNKKNQAYYLDGLMKRHNAVANDYVIRDYSHTPITMDANDDQETTRHRPQKR